MVNWEMTLSVNELVSGRCMMAIFKGENFRRFPNLHFGIGVHVLGSITATLRLLTAIRMD